MKIKYKPWAKGLMYLVEAVVIILSVFPILWVVMSSFKTNGEILSSPLALPAHFSLDTFIEIFQKYSFPTYFFNSLLAAGVSTLVSLLFYAMGAYVIAKFEFPGRKLLFALFTITLLVPSHSKTPVSYTHLDVYKRQARARRFASRRAATVLRTVARARENPTVCAKYHYSISHWVVFFYCRFAKFRCFLIGISPLFSSSDFRVRYKSYQQSRQIAIHRTTQDSSRSLGTN